MGVHRKRVGARRLQVDPAFRRDRRLSHGTTDDNGIARFLWRPNDLTATSTVQLIDETLKDGYSFVEGRVREGIGPSKPQAHDPADDLATDR